MFDMIRKAILTQKINEVKGELQRAGASLQELLLRPDLLDKLDAQTVWSLVHGLEASLQVLEQTLRNALNGPAPADPEVRRTLRELQNAVAALREALGSVTPYVEALYDAPPKATRWELVPPGTKG